MADSDVYGKIQQLSRLNVAALRIKYREVFGADVKVLHKQFLIRRIAWQLQARVQGELSERARLRIAEIPDEAELNGSAKAVVGPGSPFRATRLTDAARDPRLPPAGTLLRRRYQGREIVVKVLPDAFECDSKRYQSLSALARELTGTRWNGLVFFGLAERRHG
jgi:Protein of unknown function (DUF2924)